MNNKDLQYRSYRHAQSKSKKSTNSFDTKNERNSQCNENLKKNQLY